MAAVIVAAEAAQQEGQEVALLLETDKKAPLCLVTCCSSKEPQIETELREDFSSVVQQRDGNEQEESSRDDAAPEHIQTTPCTNKETPTPTKEKSCITTTRENTKNGARLTTTKRLSQRSPGNFVRSSRLSPCCSRSPGYRGVKRLKSAELFPRAMGYPLRRTSAFMATEQQSLEEGSSCLGCCSEDPTDDIVTVLSMKLGNENTTTPQELRRREAWKFVAEETAKREEMERKVKEEKAQPPEVQAQKGFASATALAAKRLGCRTPTRSAHDGGSCRSLSPQPRSISQSTKSTQDIRVLNNIQRVTSVKLPKNNSNSNRNSNSNNNLATQPPLERILKAEPPEQAAAEQKRACLVELKSIASVLGVNGAEASITNQALQILNRNLQQQQESRRDSRLKGVWSYLAKEAARCEKEETEEAAAAAAASAAQETAAAADETLKEQQAVQNPDIGIDCLKTSAERGFQSPTTMTARRLGCRTTCDADKRGHSPETESTTRRGSLRSKRIYFSSKVLSEIYDSTSVAGLQGQKQRFEESSKTEKTLQAQEEEVTRERKEASLKQLREAFDVSTREAGLDKPQLPGTLEMMSCSAEEAPVAEENAEEVAEENAEEDLLSKHEDAAAANLSAWERVLQYFRRAMQPKTTDSDDKQVQAAVRVQRWWRLLRTKFAAHRIQAWWRLLRAKSIGCNLASPTPKDVVDNSEGFVATSEAATKPILCDVVAPSHNPWELVVQYLRQAMGLQNHQHNGDAKLQAVMRLQRWWRLILLHSECSQEVAAAHIQQWWQCVQNRRKHKAAYIIQRTFRRKREQMGGVEAQDAGVAHTALQVVGGGGYGDVDDIKPQPKRVHRILALICRQAKGLGRLARKLKRPKQV